MQADLGHVSMALCLMEDEHALGRQLHAAAGVMHALYNVGHHHSCFVQLGLRGLDCCSHCLSQCTLGLSPTGCLRMALSGQVQQRTGSVRKAAATHCLQHVWHGNLLVDVGNCTGGIAAQQMTDYSKAERGTETVSKCIKCHTLSGRCYQACNTHSHFGCLPVLPEQVVPNRLTHRQTLLWMLYVCIMPAQDAPSDAAI